jgi:putative pre-16S rRNA nuclease
MSIGRILALDYGTKNIGLASCDELGIAVRPLPSIPNTNRRELRRRLRAVLDEMGIVSLVIGLPTNMDGSSGASVDRVRHFILHLQEDLSLPIREVDERLSTVEANEIWHTMNARQRRRYRTADSLAAAFILKRFLEES